MKKLLIRLGLIAVLVAALVYGALAFGFYQPRNVAPDSVMARVLLPSVIRAIPRPDQCGEARVSKSLIECGGICGERFDVKFRTTASSADIEKALNAHAATHLDGFETEVLSQEDSATCYEAHVAVARSW